MRHGLRALKQSAQETELSEHNVSVGYVGKKEKFRLLKAEELRGYLTEINVSHKDICLFIVLYYRTRWRLHE